MTMLDAGHTPGESTGEEVMVFGCAQHSRSAGLPFAKRRLAWRMKGWSSARLANLGKGEVVVVPRRDDPFNDVFLFKQPPTRGLGKIQFHDYSLAYHPVVLPNVEVFKEQIKLFRDFLLQAQPNEAQAKDIDYLLALGEILTLVAYGQLIIESRTFCEVEDDLLDVIFDEMVRDFSKYALSLHMKPSSSDKQRSLSL